MEREVIDALASLDNRGADFQAQVERMREFRERMRQSGAPMREEQFSIELMERLDTIGSFKLTL